MAVISVNTWQVAFGALPEFMPVLAASKRMHERHGAKVRAWQLAGAGPNVGRVTYVVRCDSYKALAVWSNKMSADAEWLKLLKDNAGSKTVSLAGHVIGAELAGLEATPLTAAGGPRARLGRVWQLEPGRGPEAMAMLQEMRTQVQRFGGQLSAVVGMFGGPNSGNITSVSEFADVEARGAYLDAAMSDPGLIAAQGRFLSAGSPLKLIGASLTTELAI